MSASVTIASGPGVGDFADGIQEEMMSATLSFYQAAAAACAEICAQRLRQLYTQLLRGGTVSGGALGGSVWLGHSADPFASTGQGLGGSMASLPGLVGESKLVGLVRSIRRRLDSLRETPQSFFRSRVPMGQNLITRDEFIQSVLQLATGASVSDLGDLFSHAVGSPDRDTAMLEEVVAAMEPSLFAGAPGSMSGPIGFNGGASGMSIQEVERVVSRVRSAVGRAGRPYDEVFRGFCRSSANVMQHQDLKRVLTTFEPDLDPDVVNRLWRTVVPDGSRGLDYAAFCSWFCPGGQPLAATGPLQGGFAGLDASHSSLGETGMLRQLLESANNPGATLHPSTLSPYSAGGAHMLQPSSPTASSRTLEPVRPRSASFGGFGGCGSGDLANHHQGISSGNVGPASRGQGIPPITQDELPLYASLHRLGRSLAAKGKTVPSGAFIVYDTNMDRCVDLGGFMDGCIAYQVPLARQEIEALFSRMAQTFPDHSRKVVFEDLDRQLQGMPNPVPQAQWACDLISAVDKIMRGAGMGLDKAFRDLNRGDAVSVLDVRDVLSRQSQLSNAQWQALLPFLDKRLDGQVPWQDLLKWAGVEVAAAPAPAVAAPTALKPLPGAAAAPVVAAPAVAATAPAAAGAAAKPGLGPAMPLPGAAAAVGTPLPGAAATGAAPSAAAAVGAAAKPGIAPLPTAPAAAPAPTQATALPGVTAAAATATRPAVGLGAAGTGVAASSSAAVARQALGASAPAVGLGAAVKPMATALPAASGSFGATQPGAAGSTQPGSGLLGSRAAGTSSGGSFGAARAGLGATGCGAGAGLGGASTPQPPGQQPGMQPPQFGAQQSVGGGSGVSPPAGGGHLGVQAQSQLPPPPGQMQGGGLAPPAGQAQSGGMAPPPGPAQSSMAPPSGLAQRSGMATPPGPVHGGGMTPPPGGAVQSGMSPPRGPVQSGGMAPPGGPVQSAGTSTPPPPMQSGAMAQPPGPVHGSGMAPPPGPMHSGGLAPPPGQVHSAGVAQPGGPVRSGGMAPPGGPVQSTGPGPLQSAGMAPPPGPVHGGGMAPPPGPGLGSGMAPPAGHVHTAGPAQPGGPVRSGGMAQPGGAMQSGGMAQPGGPVQSGGLGHFNNSAGRGLGASNQAPSAGLPDPPGRSPSGSSLQRNALAPQPQFSSGVP